MQYESDYVLRLIEQLSGLVRAATERLGLKEAEEPLQVAGRTIGLALGMDPNLASSLSAQTLVSLLRISNLDDRATALVLEALEIEAEELESRGEVEAAVLRRQQAAAVRSLPEQKSTPTI